MKKSVFVLSALCFLAVAVVCLLGTISGAETSGKIAPFRSYDMTGYPQGGFSLSAAHAKKGVTCAGCHESADPIGKPAREKWPSATKCAGCHKAPAGTVSTKDYKTNVMRTFDPHNSHEKGGCLTCHSEHYASRLSCNVGGCHDFRDLTFRKNKSSNP